LRAAGVALHGVELRHLAEALELQAAGALDSLQRLSDRRELLLAADLQRGARLEIGIGLLGASQHLIGEAAEVERPGISCSLIDGRREEPVGRLMLATEERVHASAIKLIEDALLGVDGRRTGAREEQAHAGAKNRVPGHARDSLAGRRKAEGCECRGACPGRGYDSFRSGKSQASARRSAERPKKLPSENAGRVSEKRGCTRITPATTVPGTSVAR
jgi:hypothetical protein